MRLLSAVLATGVLLSLACGSSDEAEPATAPSTPTPAAAAPDPLAGKTLAEVCMDQSLSMIRWPFDQLQADFQSLCCKPGGIEPDQGECVLDWPYSDVPPCSAYDDLRNGIFAWYGYPFEGAEWRERFEPFPWYHRREDFDAAWLTPVAAANVEKLKQLKADKVGCMD